MNATARIILPVCFIFLLATSVAAAKKPTSGNSYSNRIPHSKAPASAQLEPDARGEYLARVSAANSTTFLAYYTFDGGPVCADQGWTSHDLTVEPGDYWHVTDFATGGEACGPGTFGRLVTLEGNQSLWCGACPDAGSELLCGYAALPGYGNGWDQAYCTKACLSVDSNVVIDFLASWDSEPGYDATTVEIDNCDDDWVAIYGGIGVYDGTGSGFASVAVPNDAHSGALRVRFRFVSDPAWSDQDDLYDSDGAVIIDSLSVSDASGVVLAVEDFESESIGDIESDDWETCKPPGFGDYAQLTNGILNLQEDPCAVNFTCMWNFYKGSTYNYACNTPVPAPGQLVVPYMNARGQYIWNEIWSPYVAWTGSGTDANLEFDVYRDLKLYGLVFYVWHVRFKTAGCPGDWKDRDYIYYSSKKDWFRAIEPIGDLVDPGATEIQVALGVRDMCWGWCGVYGTGACHSHAPLFDNVEVYRVDYDGPQFAWRDIDEFQDNFASDGTITGTVRIDMAQDILPRANPAILPGDSAVIQVSDPEVGLAGDANTGWGPGVYTYVAVFPKYKYTGSQIQAPEMRAGNPRWPWVGDVVIPADPRIWGWWRNPGSATWHVFRHDSCFTSGGAIIADRYCIDLNDNLFVPGDTVYFFREAINTSAVSRYHAGGKDGVWYPTGFGATGDRNLAAQNADEVTCLPAAGLLPEGDILYVDGMNFRDAQWMFDTSFNANNLLHRVDRYDIRGPSSTVGNHPGSRVVDPVAQLSNVYRVIMWNAGDLQTAFSDGSGNPDKSDDTGMLKAFADNLPNVGSPYRSGGIHLDGDDVAGVWSGFSSASASALRTYLSYTVVSGDHKTVGVGLHPLMIGTGVPGGAFWTSDTLVVFGGCPTIGDFDVLAPAGAAVTEANYYSYPRGAIVSQTTANPGGALVGFMLSGFSFHNIANDTARGWMDRWEYVYNMLTWMNVSVDVSLGVPQSRKGTTTLSQNYPNPFNPTTNIEYSIKEPGYVSLKVYNVAGQLVKTLVDEVKQSDTVRPVRWDGRNNAGEQVSSGVYFYKLVTKGFTKTKKMVLLK